MTYECWCKRGCEAGVYMDPTSHQAVTATYAVEMRDLLLLITRIYARALQEMYVRGS